MHNLQAVKVSEPRNDIICLETSFKMDQNSVRSTWARRSYIPGIGGPHALSGYPSGIVSGSLDPSMAKPNTVVPGPYPDSICPRKVTDSDDEVVAKRSPLACSPTNHDRSIRRRESKLKTVNTTHLVQLLDV